MRLMRSILTTATAVGLSLFVTVAMAAVGAKDQDAAGQAGGKQGVTGSGQQTKQGSGGSMGGSMGGASSGAGQTATQKEFSGTVQRKGNDYILLTTGGQQYILRGNISEIAKLEGKPAKVTGSQDPNRPDALVIITAIPEKGGSMGGTGGAGGSSKSGAGGGSKGGAGALPGGPGATGGTTGGPPTGGSSSGQ